MKISRVLIGLLLSLGILLGGAMAASADEQELLDNVEVSDTLRQEPSKQITDPDGVPLDKYRDLSIYRGDNWGDINPITSINASNSDNAWDMLFTAFDGCVWLIRFMLGFEWVKWVAYPLIELAGVIESVLGGLNWLPAVTTLAAAVYGYAMVKGRVAHAWINIGVISLMMWFITTVMMNPVMYFFGDLGLFTQMKTIGENFSASLVTGEQTIAEGTNPIDSSITAQLSTIFIRDSYQEISFGKILTGDCQDVFVNAMKEWNRADDGDMWVADQVKKCDPSVAHHIDNFGFNFLDYWMPGSALSIFTIVVAVFTALVFFAIFSAAWEACMLTLTAKAALIPGAQVSFFRHVFGILAAMLLAAVGLVFFVLYLIFMEKLMRFFTTWLGELRYFVLGIFFIVMIFVAWKFRKQLKEKGNAMASRVGKMLSAQDKHKESTLMRDAYNGASKTIRTVNSIRNRRSMRDMADNTSRPQGPAETAAPRKSTDTAAPQEVPLQSTEQSSSPAANATEQPAQDTAAAQRAADRKAVAKQAALRAARAAAKRVHPAGTVAVTAVEGASKAAQRAKQKKEENQAEKQQIDQSAKAPQAHSSAGSSNRQSPRRNASSGPTQNRPGSQKNAPQSEGRKKTKPAEKPSISKSPAKQQRPEGKRPQRQQGKVPTSPSTRRPQGGKSSGNNSRPNTPNRAQASSRKPQQHKAGNPGNQRKKNTRKGSPAPQKNLPKGYRRNATQARQDRARQMLSEARSQASQARPMRERKAS